MSTDESLAAPAADVTPSELSAGKHSTLVDRVSPIAHGAGLSWLHDDANALYDELRELWRDLDVEAGDSVTIEADPDFLPNGDYVWIFKSSGYKAGAENAHGNWKQWYKYHVMLRRVDERAEDGTIEELRKPATSLNLIVEPQKQGMTYDPSNNGGQLNEVDLPYGEGSRILAQTTYVERGSRVIERAHDALADVLQRRDAADLVNAPELKRDSCRIWKLEAYIRFDIDSKHAFIRTLDKSEKLIDVGGASEIQTHKERQSEGWLEAKTSSDRWDRLGFDPLTTTVEKQDGSQEEAVVKEEIKVYQTQDWHERPKSDPFHHPKAEASLTGARNPHLSEWQDALEHLRTILLSHAEWAGVDDSDLVADDYFNPEIQQTTTIEHPEGRREDLARYYDRFETEILSECLKRQTTAAYDILSVIAERHGATYDELEAATGFSRSNLDYHVSRMKQLGLLTTVGNPAIVAFDSEYLYEKTLDVIEERIAPRFEEETLSARRLGREKRAEIRIEKREEQHEEDDETDDSDAEDADEEDADTDDDSDDLEENDEPDEWVRLDEWVGSIHDLALQVERDDYERDERDVKLRRTGESPT